MSVTDPGSTTERANFERISRLLIFGAKTLLREIFDTKCPPNILYEMLQDHSIVERLKGKLTKPEWDCLNPSPGMYGKSADFNVNLLLKLLSTICNLTPPATGWVNRPTDADHSLAADLVRITFYRNLLCLSNGSMAYKEFVSLSEEISDVMLRIAAQIGPEKRTEWQKSIHKLLKDPLVFQEGKSAEHLLQWYENDTEAVKEFMPMSAATAEVRSLETILREHGQRLRDLLRKDLIAKTRGVQGVQHSSFNVVEEEVEERTHVAETADQEKFQIEDQQGEVHQPTDKPSFSAAGILGARIRLFINSEVMSGPDVQGSSSEENVVTHESQREVRGAFIGQTELQQRQTSGPTQVSEDEATVNLSEVSGQEEAQDINAKVEKEHKDIQEAQERLELFSITDNRSGLEGTTDTIQSEVREKDQEGQLVPEHKTKFQGDQTGVERIRLKLQEGREGIAHSTESSTTQEIRDIKYQQVEGLQIRTVGTKGLDTFKEGKPSDLELDDLALQIGAKWKRIGIRLGISNDVLEGIVANTEDKAFQMLLFWRNTTTSATPYHDIYNALCHSGVGLNNVAKEFCWERSSRSFLERDLPYLSKHHLSAEHNRSAELDLQGKSSKEPQGQDQEAKVLRKEDVLVMIADNYLDSTRRSRKTDYDAFLEYMKEMRLIITGVRIGSVIITVECTSQEILDGLWEDCATGHMSEVAQKFFITSDVIREFGEVKVTVTIDEEEYKACRAYFLQFSDGSEVQDTRLLQGAIRKRKAPVPFTDSLERKRTRRFYYKGVGSPEAESEGDTGTETGSSEHMECAQTKSDDKMNVEVSGDSLETDSEALSEDWIKSMLSAGTEKCEVGESGAVWRLQNTMAACITFPQNAVKTTVVFRCTLWQSTIDFPPLRKKEALVSNVIVLACDDPLGSDFTGHFEEKVSVALSHSAANLQGYEVVIRELVDSDNNEWKDLKTRNIWKTSDTQCDPYSTPRIPFSEAKVTRCSVFAVICRLKTYTFSTQGQGKQDFSCTVPEYPDVTVTIPVSVVHKNGDFQLTLKVQEIPQQWFDDHEIIGPVLHIACSPAIELVEPAIITIPTSLQADKNVCGESSFKNAHVRLLMKSDEESSQWTEITDQLPRPADLKNGVITFQATHFSRFLLWIKKLLSPNDRTDRPPENVPLENRADRLTEHVPLEAGFSACLCRSGAKSPGESLLRYICYPVAQEVPVRKSVCAAFDVFRYGYGNSLEPLCPGELIYLELRKGLERIDDDDALVELRFHHGKFESDIDVRVSSEHVPRVEFFRRLNKKKLCQFSLVALPTTLTKNTRPVKAGVPSNDELEKLSRQLGNDWENLGRRLGYSEAELTAFRRDRGGMVDAARCMLVDWKQRMGSDATYQVLHDYLTHELVGCKLLAEEFCCN